MSRSITGVDPEEDAPASKKRKTEKMIVAQFYSKSKDADDLELGLPNWRKILSNFHPVTLVVDGREYPSVEHYFHAAKAMYSDKPDIATKFEVQHSFRLVCVTAASHPMFAHAWHSVTQGKVRAAAVCGVCGCDVMCDVMCRWEGSSGSRHR